MAEPGDASPVRTVTHLHGGHNRSESDGLPDAWFTQQNRGDRPDFAVNTLHL